MNRNKRLTNWLHPSLQGILGTEFLLAVIFIFDKSKAFNAGLAFLAGSTILTLALLNLAGWIGNLKLIKTNALALIAYGLMLSHSVVNAWVYPLDALHAVNLALAAPIILRTQKNPPYTGPVIHLISFTGLFIATLIIAYRSGEIGLNEYSLVTTTPLSLIASIQLLVMHWGLNKLQLEDITESNTELDSRLKFQSDLISVISHNIRTPLTHIYTKLEIEKMRPTKESKSMVNELSESVSHLMNIVETTLSSRNIVRSNQQPKPFYYFKETLKRLYGESCQITFKDIDVLQDIEDSDTLVFAIQNFIDNAIKFSENDKPTVLIAGKFDKLLSIISDNGPGMSLERLEIYGNPVVSNGPKSGKGIGIHLSLGLLSVSGYDVLIKTKEGEGMVAYIYGTGNHIHKDFMFPGSVYKFFPAYSAHEPEIFDLRSNTLPIPQEVLMP